MSEQETTAPEETTTTEAGVGEDTFPRSYVEELRRENGKWRQKAQRADTLAERLHTAMVRATGRLADASDLPFEEAHLDDADAMGQAIDALLEAKPHLASRRPQGDVGQGVTSAPQVDLAGILRSNAT